MNRRSRPDWRRAMAKAYARDVKQALLKHGFTPSDVAYVVPILARSFAELQLRYAWVSLLIICPFMAVTIAIFFVVYNFELMYLDISSTEGVGTLYYSASMLGIFIFMSVAYLTNRAGSRALARIAKHKPPIIIKLMFNRKVVIVSIIFDIGLFSLFFLGSVINTNLTWRQVSIVIAGVFSTLLWTGAIYYAGARIYKLLEPSIISPDLNVIRALADAVLSASVGKPSTAREFGLRKELSANICYAANLLDKSSVRLLARNDRGVEVIVRPQLETVAYGLRQSISLLALPSTNAMKQLSISLGKILIGVVTGDLSQLARPEASPSTVAEATWQDSLFGLIRWFALALGAPLAVILAVHWKWIPEGPTQSLALQFAVLCFIYASYSAFGQAGRDELSGVMSSGTSLFGWGKNLGKKE
jgi:hypothetical protein